MVSLPPTRRPSARPLGGDVPRALLADSSINMIKTSICPDLSATAPWCPYLGCRRSGRRSSSVAPRDRRVPRTVVLDTLRDADPAGRPPRARVGISQDSWAVGLGCRSVRAVVIHEFGGPEVLGVEDVPEPETPSGFLKVEVDAAGVNFADTHQSENSYLAAQELPLLPGSEVVGRVVEDRSGAASGESLVGRRIAGLVGSGGYAERALVHPDRRVPVAGRRQRCGRALAAGPGADRLAPVADLHPPRAGRVRRRPRRRRRCRHARSPAREALGCRARHRGRVVPRQAGARERRSGRTSRSTQACDDLKDALREANDGNPGRRRARDGRWHHLRRQPRRARPVRSDRDVRHGLTHPGRRRSMPAR